eukprot:scaffold80797_cov43-Cyclotella_meneghiniana.AAC.4
MATTMPSAPSCRLHPSTPPLSRRIASYNYVGTTAAAVTLSLSRHHSTGSQPTNELSTRPAAIIGDADGWKRRQQQSPLAPHKCVGTGGSPGRQAEDFLMILATPGLELRVDRSRRGK